MTCAGTGALAAGTQTQKVFDDPGLTSGQDVTNGIESAALDSALAARLVSAASKPFMVATGGGGEDRAWAVAPTADGGMIVAGDTDSYGAGHNDFLLLKYAADGTLEWARVAGGADIDEANAVAGTADNGYILAGLTASYGAGSQDALLLKYANDGTLSWARTAGGLSFDKAFAVIQNATGDYLIAGNSFSYGAGAYDALLLNYASDGTLSWAKTIGGGGQDWVSAIATDADGGAVLAGATSSYGAGSDDALLVKISPDGELPDCPACAVVTPDTGSPAPDLSSPTPTTGSPTVGTSSIALTTESPAIEHTYICGWPNELRLPLIFR